MSDSTVTTPPPPSTQETTDSLDKANALYLYRQGVEELWNLKSGKAISNAVPAHAAILFETFFKYSKNKVRIFCKNLNAEVFGNFGVVQQAKAALERNVSVDIIVQEDPQESAFKSLLSTPGIRLQKATGPIQAFELNFAVMDEAAIRMEPNRSACKATAIMHTPDKAKQLADFFDQIMTLTAQMQAASA